MVGEMDEGDQKVQPSSCKINTGDVLYNVVTIIYNILLYIWNMLRAYILKFLIERKMLLFQAMDVT